MLQRVSDEVLVPRGERLLLLIDGLDEAEPGASGQNPLPRFLPDSLPQGVRVLCASRPTYPYLSWLEARDRVRRIDLDDARWAGSNEEVVRKYWEHAVRRFEPPLDPALVAEAVRHARGNILYTLKLLDWLEEQPLERRRAELLPQGLEAFLVEVWQRLLALPALERTVALTGLGLIAAAREALPQSVLADLAGWRDVETGERFLRVTRPFLLEEPGHWRGERAWRPFHESFREFITRTLGVEGMRREHRRLAEHLCTWPVEAVGQDFHRYYALRHGVVHWLEAGDWQRVRALCTDLGYLKAKCRETEVSAAEEDLSRAAAGSTGKERGLAQELLRAVQHGSHWLRQDPQALGALPQILYNQLRSSGWTAAQLEETLSFPEGLPALRLRHPVRMSGSEIRTLLGHRGSVNACTVLPDGRRALSASDDYTLKLWDLETGHCLSTLEGHADWVNACAVLPDGRHALSTSQDGTLKLWDLETGRCLSTLQGHSDSLTACTLLPDGLRALSSSWDGPVKEWDLQSRECRRTLYGNGAFLCIATAGESLFAGDALGNVWILEAHSPPQKLPARGTQEVTEKTVDLGIVIALKEEFRVFRELVPTELRAERDEKTGQYDYTFQLPGSPHRCVVSFIGEMNPEPAALHTERLLARWNPRTVVMLGIAAGLHSDVRVGDVVVASQVDNYLASARAQPGTAPGSFEFSLGGTVFHGDHDFLSRVRNLEFAHREHFLSWSQRCQESFSKLVPLEARAELVLQRLVRSEPELLDVHLASGPVVGAAQEFTQWLRSSRDRNLKALDMESAGLVASAFKRVNPTRTLVLRGISDSGDERKATLDALGEGSLRRLAMHNATALLWTLLRAGVLPRATE